MASAPSASRLEAARPAERSPWASRLAAADALPAPVMRFLERHGSLGRDPFLWRWAQRGIRLVELPSVAPEHRDELRTAKLLAVVFNVLVDDVADVERDAALLGRLAAVPFAGALRSARPREGEAPREDRREGWARELWQGIEARARALPLARELWPALRFDYDQVFTCMRYSVLINEEPWLRNAQEHRLYAPHNMNMMVFATLDLMASPGVPREEWGLVRGAFVHAQAMGQLSNMMVTWEREIAARDVSSGVFAEALDAGSLDPAAIASLPPRELHARMLASGAEARLLAHWHQHRASFARLAGRVRSLDLESLLAGLDELLRSAQAARGRL